MKTFLGLSDGNFSALRPLEIEAKNNARLKFEGHRKVLITELKTQFDAMLSSYDVLAKHAVSSRKQGRPDYHIEDSLEQMVHSYLGELKEAAHSLHSCQVKTKDLGNLLHTMEKELVTQQQMLEMDREKQETLSNSNEENLRILKSGLDAIVKLKKPLHGVDMSPDAFDSNAIKDYQKAITAYLIITGGSLLLTTLDGNSEEIRKTLEDQAVLLQALYQQKKASAKSRSDALASWEIDAGILQTLINHVKECQISVIEEQNNNATAQASYDLEIKMLQEKGVLERAAIKTPAIRLAFLSTTGFVSGLIVSFVQPELFIAGLIIAGLALLTGMLFLMIYGLCNLGAYMSYDPQVISTELCIEDKLPIDNAQFEKNWKIPERIIPEQTPAQKLEKAPIIVRLINEIEENIVCDWNNLTRTAEGMIEDIQKNLPKSTENSIGENIVNGWNNLTRTAEGMIEDIQKNLPKNIENSWSGMQLSFFGGTTNIAAGPPKIIPKNKKPSVTITGVLYRPPL